MTPLRIQMKPVDQTRLHGEGSKGNCFQACIATIFGLPIEEAYDFWDHRHEQRDDWWTPLLEWLQARGWSAFVFTCDATGDDELRGVPCIVSGKTDRSGGVWHSTVWVGDKPFHDPHPSRRFLTRVRDVIVFVPLAGGLS